MDLFKTYRYPLMGGGLGLFLALLFLTVGFLKTIFLILFTIFGVLLGNYCQRTGLISKLVNQFK